MHLTRRVAAVLGAVALACAGCATSDPQVAAGSGGGFSPTASAAQASGPAGASGTGSPSDGVSASPSDAQFPVVAAKPLAGKTVGIDPGHDGGNGNDPAFINTMIWNGRAAETCDTTGTQTAGGYTEAQFNFSVATDLRADLIAAGARVVMTRHSNTGVGPCVTTRAQIINRAHADVAVDIHADGGPVYGRGFTVLEPVADGPNNRVIKASIAFGSDVRAAMLADTPMPKSDYYGQDGIIERDDLAGLNLTTVPKILIECGNMPNATDARLLTSPAFQHRLARAIAAAIIAYLTGQPVTKG
jgi:N-acetylmuramoyl-L-alanine amidase